jgi:GGDEF domain-containing protein
MGKTGEQTAHVSQACPHSRPDFVADKLARNHRAQHIEMDLAKRAHFDELTGFPNRALIEKHVEQALARDDRSTRFALAFIDLDNFKHINDYYSHAIGDDCW